MNVLSLFSGIGGLDLGLQRAGMMIAGQVEIDPWCRRVLAKHWPEVPRHDDVRTCAEWWGDRLAPDLVAGGFPCQPVSLAGRGLAQADERWLWPAFRDVIRHLRPRYVFVENVPGLLGRGMGDVLGDLAGLGYDAEWDCLSAADFGAPHIRKRVWIAAYTQREQLRDEPGRRDGQSRAAATIARDDGTAQSLADTAGERRQRRTGCERARRHTAIRRQTGDLAGDSSPSHVANPGRAGLNPRRGLGGTWQAPQRSGWWAVEPGVGRVAHGVPRRVDRLRGLGNAVVPQVAEHIGRMIMEAAP